MCIRHLVLVLEPLAVLAQHADAVGELLVDVTIAPASPKAPRFLAG